MTPAGLADAAQFSRAYAVPIPPILKWVDPVGNLMGATGFSLVAQRGFSCTSAPLHRSALKPHCVGSLGLERSSMPCQLASTAVTKTAIWSSSTAMLLSCGDGSLFLAKLAMVEPIASFR